MIKVQIELFNSNRERTLRMDCKLKEGVLKLPKNKSDRRRVVMNYFKDKMPGKVIAAEKDCACVRFDYQTEPDDFAFIATRPELKY